MRFLLTNDDGVHADGLRALIDKVIELGDHTALVVAPDRERSACGHGISIHHPIEVKALPSDNPRVKIYAASGTPADCVKLGVAGLSDSPPDFVISGVNRGPNLGTDVFYSGTVSAAMEGALLGIRSMAVSVTAFENLDYRVAADFAIEQAILAASDPGWPMLVNVNVPAVSGDSVSGVAITRLGVQLYRDAIARRTDPKGREWYWLSGTLVDDCEINDTDTCAIRRNVISVTPLLTDLTDPKGISSLGERSLHAPSQTGIPRMRG
ncbi:MAG: 5'/3'-nucleotidase SurE [Bacillota bacterium]